MVLKLTWPSNLVGQVVNRSRSLLNGLFISLVAAALMAPAARAQNPIVVENTKTGTAEWVLTDPATNREIEGYASLTSVDLGEDISFFVSTDSQQIGYTITVYRFGWYGGSGGRQMMDPVEINPDNKGQGKGKVRSGLFNQPTPRPDQKTGLIECKWGSDYTLLVPSDWTSGIYLAKLTAVPSGKQSYIIFVVRDDDRPADLLYQMSVTTYQAYNNWGGKSLYGYNSTNGPARKVSFNRPYYRSPIGGAPASGNGAGEFLVNYRPSQQLGQTTAAWECNMVRFLEREGYDVTYCTNIDVHEDANLLSSHKGFLSVGHDEYWSWQMRQNVTAARDRGVDLGFFSSNTCYWQVRLEPSPVNGEADRTLVCYKDYSDPYAQDSTTSNNNLITIQWRDLGLPENALLGVMYVQDPVNGDIVIYNSGSWVCAGTGVSSGDRLPGLLGYEVDSVYDGNSGVPDNGNTPMNTDRVAHSPYTGGFMGGGISDMTTYTAASGATVFATGSMQWSWGLDDYNYPALRDQWFNPVAQQMTRNVLNRFISSP